MASIETYKRKVYIVGVR